MVTMLTPLLGIEMQKKRREVMTMTPSHIPADIALRDRPSRFKCFKCASTHADFFVTKSSLQNPTEVVVPLCFRCYVQKRRWIWKLVKENNTNNKNIKRKK
jgi:hypothetical protein